MPPATSAPSFFPGKPLSLFGEETDLPEKPGLIHLLGTVSVQNLAPEPIASIFRFHFRHCLFRLLLFLGSPSALFDALPECFRSLLLAGAARAEFVDVGDAKRLEEAVGGGELALGGLATMESEFGGVVAELVVSRGVLA